MKEIRFQTDVLRNQGAGDPALSVGMKTKAPEAGRTKGVLRAAAGEDKVSFAKTGTEGSRVNQMFQSFLERLRSQYPKVQIMIEQPVSGERDILSQVLDDMGDGAVLILSNEFLAGLHGGEESYDRRTKALIECLRKLAGMGVGAGVWLEEDQAIFWKQEREPAVLKQIQKQDQEGTIWDMLPSPAEEEAKKFRISSSSSYQIAWAYNLMARAKTKTMVQNAMQEARRSIFALKLMTMFGSEKDQARAKAAIRSMEKLLLRGNRKLRRFSDEALTETRKKRAIEREQEEKALREELELRRQKKSRAIGDGAIYKEGQLESLNVPGYYKRVPGHRREPELPYEPLPVPAVPVPQLSGGFTVEVQGPAVGFAVTEVMEF